MVGKLIGFVTGAALASVALIAWSVFGREADEDRLISALKDHCLPYVTRGAVPFDGMGRAPGVFDAVELNDRLQNGGAALIHDLRFVAEWGVGATADGAGRLRLCMVGLTYGAGQDHGFEVEPEGFIARYQRVIAPEGDLVSDLNELGDGPQTVSWTQPGRGPAEGLRVVMVAEPGRVYSILVVQDLER